MAVYPPTVYGRTPFGRCHRFIIFPRTVGSNGITYVFPSRALPMVFLRTSVRYTCHSNGVYKADGTPRERKRTRNTLSNSKNNGVRATNELTGGVPDNRK